MLKLNWMSKSYFRPFDFPQDRYNFLSKITQMDDFEGRFRHFECKIFDFVYPEKGIFLSIMHVKLNGFWMSFRENY